MKHLDTIPLANGLALELQDDSKKIAADRYQVRLIASIDIEVNKELLIPGKDPSWQQIVSRLGTRVRYEKEAERNFIEDKQKNLVLNQLVESVRRHAQTYLEHPEFARRYILKAYAQAVRAAILSGHPRQP